MSDCIESKQSFLERLCFSFACEIHKTFDSPSRRAPFSPHLEFYGKDFILLLRVQAKTESYLSSLKSPCFSSTFSLHLCVPTDYSSRPGTYSLDVDYFLDLYQRRKAEGKSVIF